MDEWCALFKKIIYRSISEWRRRLKCVVQQNGRHIEHIKQLFSRRLFYIPAWQFCYSLCTFVNCLALLTFCASSTFRHMLFYVAPASPKGTVAGIWEGFFAFSPNGLVKYCELPDKLHDRGLVRNSAAIAFCALHLSQSCPLLPGSSWLQPVAPRLSVSSSDDMLESNRSLVSRTDCTIWPSPPTMWVQKVGPNLVLNSVPVLKLGRKRSVSNE